MKYYKNKFLHNVDNKKIITFVESNINDLFMNTNLSYI